MNLVLAFLAQILVPVIGLILDRMDRPVTGIEESANEKDRMRADRFRRRVAEYRMRLGKPKAHTGSDDPTPCGQNGGSPTLGEDSRWGIHRRLVSDPRGMVGSQSGTDRSGSGVAP